MTWGRPPLAVWEDPEAALRDELKARLALPHLATRPEVVGARVGLALPDGYTPRTAAPFVRVGIDGTPSTSYPVYANTTLRVVVWHRDRTLAKRLAALCHGIALTYSGGPAIASVSERTGLQPGRDPDNGGDIVAFTVGARTRATPVT